MAENSRRLLLRVGVKLMLLFALGTTIYVLSASIGNREAPAEQASFPATLISLSSLPTDNPQRIVWPGGNLILIRRDETLLNSLNSHGDRLEDPYSRQADQPASLPSPYRSLQPTIFLAFDRGTDMGCPLNWVPPGAPDAPLQPWPGGFRDNCRGSWYDSAGRVFSGQEAKRNLVVPPYRLIDENLLQVGDNGDNARPAN